jgi:transposase
MDKSNVLMEIKPQLNCGVGIDIHKESLVACFYIRDKLFEVKQFGTFTSDLLQLRDAIVSYDIPDVLMESTGVYWIALCAILTEAGIKVHVVNPKFTKNMPKEKTDKKDAKWLCKLLVNGQIRDSYIASDDQRSFRNLCRSRTKYSQQITQAYNRIVKILESRNIKIRSVVSNMSTLTAIDIVKQLADGVTDIDHLVSLCRGKVQKKKELMRSALQGILTREDRNALKRLLGDIAHFEKNIKEIEEEIKNYTDKIDPKLLEGLDNIAGVSKKSAEIVLAEIGDKVDAWQTPDQLAAWSGTAPGDHETADKQKPAGRRGGNIYLRTALIQVAWAAIRTKNSYWRAFFAHLKRRMHVKKAIVVIARKLVKVIYKVIKGTREYIEYGAEYFIQRIEQGRIAKTNAVTS